MPSPKAMTFPTALQSKPATRILIVRLSAHGDLIHTLPLLSALKKQNPNLHVGWLVESSAAPLLENHPLLEHIHVSHRTQWLCLAKNPLNWPQIFREILALLAELRQANYEISLDVQGLLKSAIWPFLAGIPKRYGFHKTREFGDWFYTHKLTYHDLGQPNIPVVERFLDFARALNGSVEAPEFVVPPVSEAARQHIDSLFAETDANLPLIVIAPFTRWESKHWLSEHWIQVLDELSRWPVQVAILGAPGDTLDTAHLLKQLPDQNTAKRIHNLVGKTTWPDLYALFEQTRLLIGLDSAPLHIANAVGIPDIIGIYGPTASGRTGPIGRQHTTLTTALHCQPCHKAKCPLNTQECMRQITPVAVLAMARQHLNLSLPAETGTS